MSRHRRLDCNRKRLQPIDRPETPGGIPPHPHTHTLAHLRLKPVIGCASLRICSSDGRRTVSFLAAGRSLANCVFPGAIFVGGVHARYSAG